MERTKPPKINTNQRIQTLSELVARLSLASQLGYQYGTSRDLYEALGWKVDLTYSDYYSYYTRLDIAQAIIDRPVDATWSGGVSIIESDDDQETALEKEWKALDNKLQLSSRFNRVDKLTGLQEYGVLLLGLDDVKEQADFQKPVRAGKRKLLYVKPFSQNSAAITTYESDVKNERYGYPLLYEIQVQDVSSGSSSTVKVHYSRVIHIIDKPLESEISGEPRLKVVFNRLYDLEKLVGGSAEMFWRGARPGYAAKIDKDFMATTAFKEGLQTQVDEYEHNLRRILAVEGIDWQSLAQQVADPKSHVDVQIQMISAVTGIPKRILTGSERGELSSSQDRDEWNSYIQNRRDDHAEPRIVRPFVDKLIEIGVLPKPSSGEYQVEWSDLFAQSEKEQVAIGKERALALQSYVANPMAEAIVPPSAFFEKFLGFSQDDIDLISEMVDQMRTENDGKLPGEEFMKAEEPDDGKDSEGNKQDE